MTRSRYLGIPFAVAAMAVSFALAGCGGGNEGSPDATYVNVEDFKFRPARIEGPVGGQVFWRNFDKAKHTATAKEGSGSQFDTGTLRKGTSRSVTFNKKGTFAYTCSFHAFMEGTVEVR